MFVVCVSYHFVFFSTIFEENRENVCVITGSCSQTLSASNTMAACNLLRLFKFQKGQGSAVISIYVFFVLFFVLFFVIFSYLSTSFRFSASHFVFYFVYVHTTDKKEQLTWTLFRILHFVMFFVSISYHFVFFSTIFEENR